MDPSRTKIYFAADAHLGNRWLADPQAAEKRLVRWLDRIGPQACAVYFLGDMFDYWYEYRHVAPRGFVRFLGKLAELADSGVEIHLFTGNHDIWMFDYLPRETGAVIHRGPEIVDLMGKRFFLAHGDEVGKRPPMLRLLQAMFRNRICQLLYASIHPRWTFAFARWWSYSSRKNGMNGQTTEAQERKIACLVDFAKSFLQAHPDIDYFIFGHRHVLFDTKLNATSRLLIAGDWMQLFSFIEWDGDSLRTGRSD
ncbi:MAG: UDP-2,3-diacylglucosamine diphosphatase [Tannerella sp.]|jgi:UDP-2,3-diacylglucosamine hydrolase|nr:UDP-2,3-diacylglucosamine diphosphatase [Tannerella sp.]